MTGTAMTEAAEFMDIYKLSVVEIPTNVNIARVDHQDAIYKSLDEKQSAIIKIVKECRERKQPVLVGTVSIEKSEQLSNELRKLKIPHQVLNARYHEQEAQIISQAGRPGAVTIATNMAGRGTDIQLGGNFEMRVAQEVDATWPEERKVAVARRRSSPRFNMTRRWCAKPAALYVIGTERHESAPHRQSAARPFGPAGRPGRIIVLPLARGRSHAHLRRRRHARALLTNTQIGLREGEALSHRWISKALERAQARVEAQNFEIRKNLLKFDNVMNDQRKVIYEQRREIMNNAEVEALVTDMRHSVIEELVARTIPARSYAEQWDLATLKTETPRILALDVPIDAWGAEEGIDDKEFVTRLIDASDHKMAAKAANVGPMIFRQMEKTMVLQSLDQHWKEHLLNLDHLRQGINLRAFGQRDPLNEYKSEAFAMFEGMLGLLRESVTQTLSLVEFHVDPAAARFLEEQAKAVPQGRETRDDPALIGTGLNALPQQLRDNVQPFPAREAKRTFDKNDPTSWGKVQRNDPCPCGSGKKYKHCHGKLTDSSSDG